MQLQYCVHLDREPHTTKITLTQLCNCAVRENTHTHTTSQHSIASMHSVRNRKQPHRHNAHGHCIHQTQGEHTHSQHSFVSFHSVKNRKQPHRHNVHGHCIHQTQGEHTHTRPVNIHLYPCTQSKTANSHTNTTLTVPVFTRLREHTHTHTHTHTHDQPTFSCIHPLSRKTTNNHSQFFAKWLVVLAELFDGQRVQKLVGLARTIYIRFIYGDFGRDFFKYTVIHRQYISFGQPWK